MKHTEETKPPKVHDDVKPPEPGKPGPKPGPESGPKERELAIELTLAVIDAAEFPESDPMAVAKATEDIYRRMLALIGPAGPQPLAPPPPHGDDVDLEDAEESAE